MTCERSVINYLGVGNNVIQKDKNYASPERSRSKGNALEYTKELGSRLETVVDLQTLFIPGGAFLNPNSTASDFAIEGVAALFPVAKLGKVLKFGNAFKFSDEITELISDGNRLEGKLKINNNSDVIFDAKISGEKDELILSEIGFYQTKGDDILGAKNKGSLGTLPLKILTSIKNLAKEAGHNKLTIQYKRALYDDTGNFIGYGEDVSKTINLNN